MVISKWLPLTILISMSTAEAFTPGKILIHKGHLVFRTSSADFPAQVKHADETDLNFISSLNHETFPLDNPSQKDSEDWVSAHSCSATATYSRYYVLSYQSSTDKIPLAYVLWTLEKGFKPKATLKLEQLGIDSEHRKKVEKVGTALIRLSLQLFQEEVLTPRKLTVAALYTFVGSRNFTSIPVYEKVLGMRSRGKMGILFPLPEGSDQEVLLLNEDAEAFLQTNPIEQFLRP